MARNDLFIEAHITGGGEGVSLRVTFRGIGNLSTLPLPESARDWTANDAFAQQRIDLLELLIREKLSGDEHNKAIRSFLRIPRYRRGAIFLQVKDKELRALNWEDLVRKVLRVFPGAESDVSEDIVLVRSSEPAKTPAKFVSPIRRITIANTQVLATSPPGEIMGKLADLLRAGYDAAYFRGSIRSAHPDIVFELGDIRIRADDIALALSGSATKIVLLEVIAGGYIDIQEYAYELALKTGLIVIIVPPSQRTISKSVAIPSAAYDFDAIRTVFLRSQIVVPEGTDRILRAASLVLRYPGIIRRYLSQLREELNYRIRKFLRKRKISLPRMFPEAGDAADFEAPPRLPRLRRKPATDPGRFRVVNTWFKFGHNTLSDLSPLKTNTNYQLVLQIGNRKAYSNVRSPVPFPDEYIKNIQPGTGAGVELIVKLFSNDLTIAEPEKDLTLLPPPAESNEVVFNIRTGPKQKEVRLRAGIYYRNNLVQSVIVRATVMGWWQRIWGNQSKAGNWTEVDFSLNDYLTDLEYLQERTLTIAVNGNDRGNHSLFISGKEMTGQLDFTEGQLKSAAANARDVLQRICSDRSSGSFVYLYNAANEGSTTKLKADMFEMARRGYVLYNSLVGQSNEAGWELHRRLEEALKTAKQPIQIASTRSAKFVFPWAVIYNKPFEEGNLSLCGQFLEDLENQAAFRCIEDRCPNHDKGNIVCPSGFWGYRHIIEQPISLSPGASPKHMAKINVAGSASMTVGVNVNLQGFSAHELDLAKIPNLKYSVQKSRADLMAALKSGNDNVIYLYCHGLRNNYEGWLSIGRDEQFHAHSLLNISFQTNPFVLINGCETVGFGPDDLIDFNNNFNRCNASGVMGTEISLPEVLAAHFASGFLKLFLSGSPVGQSVLYLRHQLLRSKNLLGLAYTPYCLSQLYMDCSRKE